MANQIEIGPINGEFSLYTDLDVYLFKEGTHYHLHDKMGAHPVVVDGKAGTYFSVWAPNAREMSVVGDFNGWNPEDHKLRARSDGSGIWEGFISGLPENTLYKYHVRSHFHGYEAQKIDPFAFGTEIPPKTASVVRGLDYQWEDQSWMETRHQHNAMNAPWSVYEMHIGSWRKVPEDGNRSLSYREMAPLLAHHVKEMGFTHVEFMPVMEHPFYGSWGYQITGYFAPSSRFGSAEDLMFLIDYLHQMGIGVILDWVPSHFASDGHGLQCFDGTHLYEHADNRKGFHPDWGSYIFNYGRNEIRSFLISNAFYWLEKYHVDGLRIDAVASMLYLDYSRKHGEWIPNQYGGNENLEAISFLRQANEAIYKEFPDVQTIAEESTAFPGVSRPVYVGGLGFGFKWNMGWMHDILDYFSKDSVYRKYHHNNLTFAMLYAFNENFMLPISHDEVVHGKCSLISKMPGCDWEKFANLRLLLGYMYMQPGHKLLFMGSEFGQWAEWNHDHSLDWHLTNNHQHKGVMHWLGDLNRRYAAEPAMHNLPFSGEGFYWVDFKDWEQSIVTFARVSADRRQTVIGVFNFTPMARYNYRIGFPHGGWWEEILNSDAQHFGGSGHGNFGGVESVPFGSHSQPFSACITLPPLGMVAFKKTV